MTQTRTFKQALSDPFTHPLDFFMLFLGMFLLGSFIGLASCGCTPASSALGGHGASVVMLIEPRDVGRPPSLENTTEPGSTAAYHRIAFVPTCNAFAVNRDGNLYLVTAEHCVHEHALGAVLRYLPPSGWGHAFARLTLKDEAHDRAMLTTDSHAGGLVALLERDPPGAGAHVVAASAYYEAVSAGVLVGPLGVERYGTTQTVVRGWSGSPELDDRGRVWGIVSQCPGHTDNGSGWECEPGQTIAVGLP